MPPSLSITDIFIKKAFKWTVQVNSSDPDLINNVDCYFQVKIHTISQFRVCIKKSASHLKRETKIENNQLFKEDLIKRVA